MDQIAATTIMKALDGLSMRQLFTAQNIANANTPDYQPVHVSFEDSLKSAAAKGIDAIESVVAKTSLAEGNGLSTDMRLDLELAAASQTAMRYSALIDILGRQMALTRSVVTGGQ